ncbi:MAG: hypothetical protein M1833_006349 [Piccolia ochrophora]|nr:MAG: hypothetical protein M1833_006349 [Piccolia ochrophora]
MGVHSWRPILKSSLVAWGLLFLPFAVTALPADPNGDDDFDVAIIGGGSSGTYAAIRLQDLGKKIVLVEATERLGSHAYTWTDPETNTPIDIGVQIFDPDKPIVDEYLARLNISLGPTDLEVGGPTDYFDFSTGKSIGYEPPSQEETEAAFARWAELLDKYSYLDDGYYLPEPVPEELLLPFGEFAKRYKLEAAVPFFALFAEGIGDFAQVPALYLLHFLDKPILSGSRLRTTAAHNVSLIYTHARAILGDSVLLNTRVSALSRPANALVSLTLSIPGRPDRKIRAKRVIAAFPQLLPNFAGWDLDDDERGLFTEFAATGIHCAVVRHSGIEANHTLQNVAPDTAYNLPRLPAVYNYGPSRVPGLVKAYYGIAANTDAPESASRDALLDTLTRLGLPTADAPQPVVEVDKSHFPYFLRVGVDQIRAGFYNRLYALQGHRSIFYTGAALSRQNSASIWRFTEQEVIRKIMVGV